MKEKIVVIFLYLFFFNILSGTQMRIEGYYEGIIENQKESEDYEWDASSLFYKFDTRLYADPFPFAHLYFFFQNKNFGDYDSFGTKYYYKTDNTTYLNNAQLSFRQERNNNGFETKLFFRGSDNYWLDGTMLELLDVDKVKNDDNGRGVRFDFWHSLNGSASYVFSDFSGNGNNAEDIHLARLRQSFFNNKLFGGLFYFRRNRPSGIKEDYEEVAATDIKFSLGRYDFNSEFSFCNDYFNEEFQTKNKEFREKGFTSIEGIKDILKSNIALKGEIKGFRIGNSNIGFWNFSPGYWSYGETFQSSFDKDDNPNNEYGFWLNSYFLVPTRAITVTLNWSQYKKHIPNIYQNKQYYDPSNKLYSEVYLEFINGFKGKVYLERRKEEDKGIAAKYYDLFTELSVENRLGKFLTQFMIRDWGDLWEKQQIGIECSINLSEKLRLFTRALISEERFGLRQIFFGEIQYKISGNSNLYIQYGPNGIGDNNLINDDDFKNGGTMQKYVRMFVQGWF